MKSTLIPLPIDAHLNSILDKLKSPLPFILTASPGTGKTTRVPILSLALAKRLAVVIVPKRIAAIGAAIRVCEENQFTLGEEVGYQVRFDSKVTSNTRLIYMTEGLFLKRIQDLNFLNQIDYVFLDEFHERSKKIDLILGFLFEKYVLEQKMKIVVMSATLAVDKLKTYFGECVEHHVEAPPYPLEKIYIKTPQHLVLQNAFYQQLKDTLVTAVKTGKKDTLVFLPGQKEIQKALNEIRPAFPSTLIEVAHGSLGLEAQKKLIRKTHDERRIILSTNIAESSITLPDLDTVVDAGLEKRISLEPKMGFHRLDTYRISQFSAVQRQGRANRTQKGYVFKLWNERDELSMSESRPAEITYQNIFEEILFLLSHNINPMNFSWFEKPSHLKIQSTLAQLQSWNLIDQDYQLTPLGHHIQELPLDIEDAVLFYRMIEKSSTRTLALEYFSRFESVSFEDILSQHHDKNKNDLIKIIEMPLNQNQKRVYDQLSSAIDQIPTQNSVLSAETELFKIHALYFPYRVIRRKNMTNGTSLSGRGVELSKHSTAGQYDFYLALNGFEKSNSISYIVAAVGLPKDEALKILSSQTEEREHLVFDSEQGKFFKEKQKWIGVTTFGDVIRTPISSRELDLQWKAYFKNEPQTLLQQNTSYLRLKELIEFIRNKNHIFKLDQVIENIELNSVLQKFFIENDFSLNALLTDDFISYSEQFLLLELSEIIKNAPDFIKLPSGRTANINYSDAKAPMISVKIQHCFGWLETPQIFNNKIPLTIELLAPNMRPAQTTQDLKYFWKNSYLEIRKELRARYPKHPWPEDPTKFSL